MNYVLRLIRRFAVSWSMMGRGGEGKVMGAKVVVVCCLSIIDLLVAASTTTKWTISCANSLEWILEWSVCAVACWNKPAQSSNSKRICQAVEKVSQKKQLSTYMNLNFRSHKSQYNRNGDIISITYRRCIHSVSLFCCFHFERNRAIYRVVLNTRIRFALL